jgi:hydroxyethylthiazole kinase
MGCAATALVAAFAALTQDRLAAAASALLVIGIAGEIAAQDARGPGTFQPAFLDALHALDAATIIKLARVS